MHVLIGGTGHIGSALAALLLARGEAVTMVTRSEDKRAIWQQKGAQVELADVHDVARIRAILARATRAYVLNPPAPPGGDAPREERETVRALLAALDGAKLEQVVAASTYGAQPGERLGDLGVLYELEQGLARLPLPCAVIRGAYYFSNWDMALDGARDEGVLDTLFPADFELPMVAPRDLAVAAARLLTSPTPQTGLHSVEGPQRYTPRDVADAFAEALNRPVRVRTTPEAQWVDSLQQVGFSPVAAESMAAMTRATLRSGAWPHDPERGTTTLQQYVRALVVQR